MTGLSRELLYLCCRLGRNLHPLSWAQYCVLLRKCGQAPDDPCRQPLSEEAVVCALGDAAVPVLQLLAENTGADALIRSRESSGVQFCTRNDADYPRILSERLKEDAPPVLFLLGDRSLLAKPAIALVGSRELNPDNAVFAASVGRDAASRGFSLCSGDARGADRTGQDACLRAGGTVVSFVADSLLSRTEQQNLLYVSEEGAEYRFSAYRALRRNRLIHAFGQAAFVAQAADGKGGSWSGAVKNLSCGWCPVYVYEDGSPASRHLLEQGARPFSEWK